MNTKQISINRENNMDNIKDNFSQMTKHGEYKGNNERQRNSPDLDEIVSK